MKKMMSLLNGHKYIISLSTDKISIGCQEFSYQELEDVYKHCTQNRPKVEVELGVWYMTSHGERMFIDTEVDGVAKRFIAINKSGACTNYSGSMKILTGHYNTIQEVEKK